MNPEKEILKIRKLSQQHAYTSLQLHESIGKKIGLPGTDHKYLGFLIQKGKMTAGELAELTGLTTGAITGLIDRFEKKELVKRQYDKSDRRKVIIVPNNDKIIELIIPFYQDFQDNTDLFLESFNKDELNVLERYFLGTLKIMQEKKDSLKNK